MSAPVVIDRPLVRDRRARALKAPRPGADFLLRRAAEETAERLATVTRTFDVAVDLGGHRGIASALLSAMPGIGHVIRADSLVADTASAGPRGSGPDLVFDEEALPFAPGSVDLAVSLLQLHLVNDLPGALVQVFRSLRPDGLFLAVVPAGDTLHELKASLFAAESEIAGGVNLRVLPFASVASLASLMQRAGFSLPVVDVDRLTVRYATFADLLADLRAMGATNVLAARDGRPPRRALFARAAEIYAERYADADGRLRATFEFVSLSGWSPHESQQQPLRPGSAKARLADALGTREVRTGAKAAPPGAKPPQKG